MKSSEVASFLRTTCPVGPLAGVAALGQAVAYADHRFVRAGAAAAVNGVGLLLSAIMLGGSAPSSTDLAICVLVGYLAQAAWMAPDLARIRSTPTSGPGEPPTSHKVTWTLLTLTCAALIYKGQPVIERTIASGLSSGSTAIMGYGLKVALGLQAFSGTLTTVAMPSFARSFANNRHSEAARALSLILAVTGCICIVLVTYVLIAASDVVRLLYGRGHLSLPAESSIGNVVTGYLLLIVTGSLAGPVVNIHYARNRQRWVASVGVAGVVISGGACFALAQIFGVTGVAVGTGIGGLVTLGVFAYELPAQLEGWSWKRWLREHERLWLVGGVGCGLSVAAVTELHFALPTRNNFGGLIAVLMAKGAVLLIGLTLAAVLLRWDPRLMLASDAEA